MAENLLVVRSQVDQTAGRKSPAGVQNRLRCAVVQSAAAYVAPANGDTAATKLVLKQGSRIALPITISCGAGTAASTLSVGIRDAVTKVAIDATAIVNAAAINAAATVQVNTGTKCINGQEYYLPQDCEIYLTFAGAAGAANQQFRVEVPYIAP